MAFFVRKLTRDRWVPAFDSDAAPEELLSFLAAERGVSLWKCEADEDSLPVVVNVVAGYESRPPSFLHFAQIDEDDLDSLRLELLTVPAHEAPVARLRTFHHELAVSTHEEAARFVSVVREAPRGQFSRAQVESAILRLHDSGELIADRCGKFAREVLDRARPREA